MELGLGRDSQLAVKSVSLLSSWLHTAIEYLYKVRVYVYLVDLLVPAFQEEQQQGLSFDLQRLRPSKVVVDNIPVFFVQDVGDNKGQAGGDFALREDGLEEDAAGKAVRCNLPYHVPASGEEYLRILLFSRG